MDRKSGLTRSGSEHPMKVLSSRFFRIHMILGNQQIPIYTNLLDKMLVIS